MEDFYSKKYMKLEPLSERIAGSLGNYTMLCVILGIFWPVLWIVGLFLFGLVWLIAGRNTEEGLRAKRQEKWLKSLDKEAK